MRITDSSSTLGTSVRLPADLANKMKDIGVQNDVSQTEVMIVLMRLGLYELGHNYKGRYWEARVATLSRMRTGETP